MPSDDVPPSIRSTRNARFVRIVHQVMNMQRATGSQRSAEAASRPVLRTTRRHDTGLSNVSMTAPSATVRALVPKLRNLDVSQTLDVHSGIVKDLQFSPDGRMLATTGYVDANFEWYLSI